VTINTDGGLSRTGRMLFMGGGDRERRKKTAEGDFFSLKRFQKVKKRELIGGGHAGRLRFN